MKTRFLSKRLVFLTISVCFLTFLPLAGTFDRAAAEPPPADRAAQYLKSEYEKNGMNNSDMGVGSYAFYILTQAGVDTGAWKHEGISLKESVISAINSDIANADQDSAKLLAQDLAAAQALGRENLAGQLLVILKNRQGGHGFDDKGPLSIYSNVPAFDLLSRAGVIGQLDAGLAREYILGKQYAGAEEKYYGSWGSSDNGLYYADFIAVTGAVRMLHRMDPGGSDAAIQKAVKDGLAWLKNQQKNDGNFTAGMDDTLIDTCEVIVTLKSLGMDPEAWRSSEGKSAVDYLTSVALNPDGSFGQSQNVMDAVWVLWACQALNEEAGGQPQAQPEPKTQPEPQSQPAPVSQIVPQAFKDTAGHWAQEPISRLAERGIAAGYSDGAFRPETQVTRNEISAMMVRLLKPEPASPQDLQLVNDSFADAGDIPRWALEAAAVALREGLISGCPRQDGSLSFEGGRVVNRAEISVMMARVIEMKLGRTEPKILDFTDNDLIPGWARSAAGIVYAKEIAGGYPDRTFRAEKPVTRAEAASMIMRLVDQVEIE